MHLTDQPWVRLFYRNGQSAVFREGPDLDRALARKVPGVIHREVALIHRCIQCGTEGPWGPEWMCYPIWDRIAKHHNCASAEVIYCGRACWIDATGGFDLPSWINTNQEPNRDRERQSAWWAANQAERERKDSVVAHRKVPMPEWPGTGWCRWCAGQITGGRRKNWHPDCLREYWLHSDLAAQVRHVRARDGRECAVEGCTAHGVELDHRRPLWSIRHLPAMMRRVFYGPSNLWLLCARHHREKTAIEAGQRAAKKAAAQDISD